MSARPKLILIIGLGHSGTTILDATLGCAPEVVGVGEALRIIDPTPIDGPNWTHLRKGELDQINCSCGQTAEICPVWATTGVEIATGPNPALKQGFSQVYQAALNSKPGANVILESTPGALRHKDLLKDYDVRVVHVTRDVRSWAASRNKRRGTALWLGHLIWGRHTAAISKKLAAFGAPVFSMGYEEFALRPEQMMQTLCNWLEVTYVPAMLTPFGATGSHIISGNRSVQNRSLARRLQYDGSWMARPGRALAANLVYAVLAPRNHQLVYGNDVIGHKR